MGGQPPGPALTVRQRHLAVHRGTPHPDASLDVVEAAHQAQAARRRRLVGFMHVPQWIARPGQPGLSATVGSRGEAQTGAHVEVHLAVRPYAVPEQRGQSSLRLRARAGPPSPVRRGLLEHQDVRVDQGGLQEIPDRRASRRRSGERGQALHLVHTVVAAPHTSRRALGRSGSWNTVKKSMAASGISWSTPGDCR